MTNLDDVLNLTEAMAVGLGHLEVRLIDLGVHSRFVKHLDCLGPKDGVCRCCEGWCIPPMYFWPVQATQVATAVRKVWPDMVTHIKDVSLDIDFVADLNARIRRAAGLPDAIQFVDQGDAYPWPGVPGRSDWTGLIENMNEICDEEQCFDEWGVYIMSQLTWGQHVPVLGLTTGWLLASALRLARGRDVEAPNLTEADDFMEALDGGRPGLWDCESMRGKWPYTY